MAFITTIRVSFVVLCCVDLFGILRDGSLLVADAFVPPKIPCLLPSRLPPLIFSAATSPSRSPSLSREALKQDLLQKIADTPAHAPTSQASTQSILGTIRELERVCPMLDDNSNDDLFLNKLLGNWELLWTTQDEQSDEWSMAGPFRRWINPLENQAYSNNSLRNIGNNNNSSATSAEDGLTTTMSEQTGRANPILPRPIQDRLESMGLIDTTTARNDHTGVTGSLIRSSQSIDLAKNLIRNVVSFQVPVLSNNNNKPTAVILTVLIKFWPDNVDIRKINVKFNACRIRILPQPAMIPSFFTDINIPLGFLGPTGWLRTTYLDDELRITRGFKGSVFVLVRQSANAKRSTV